MAEVVTIGLDIAKADSGTLRGGNFQDGLMPSIGRVSTKSRRCLGAPYRHQGVLARNH